MKTETNWQKMASQIFVIGFCIVLGTGIGYGVWRLRTDPIKAEIQRDQDAIFNQDEAWKKLSDTKKEEKYREDKAADIIRLQQQKLDELYLRN